ncbi:hypothetical protein [Streptomyces sp. NPDC058755]|uniref:hypothetical protein n=1 Tax=Streptomyces sp. NPDC058755 TaxID=3346624 RepID=UPI0036C87815
MRRLLAAFLNLLPSRGAHHADTPPLLIACPPVAALRLTPARRTRPYPTDVIAADDLPPVRPYIAVWERERDEREWRLQQEWRRAPLGQDCFPWEAAV